MKIERSILWRALVALTVVLFSGCTAPGGGPSTDTYWPGRELVTPHVSGDRAFTNTYDNWKDRDALMAAIRRALPDQEMNYKNVRWLKQDKFNGSLLMEDAFALYRKPNAAGRSCSSCHGADGSRFRGVAARYPVYDKERRQVTALIGRINDCASRHLGQPMPEDGGDNNLLAAFVTSFSHGMPIQVDVSTPGPLKDAFERGRNAFFKRTGQLGFACASCHTPPSVLKQLRGMRPSGPFGDAASYPIYEFPDYPERHYIVTLQHQIKACAMLSRTHTSAEGGPEYTDLELFLTGISNGHPINFMSSYYGETLQ